MRFSVPDDVSLAEALVLFKATYKEGEFLDQSQVSLVIRIIENPSYSIKIFGSELFPGRATLKHHDYLHALLGVKGQPEGEAFVIGATMGSTGKMNGLKAFLFLWSENIFAPAQYHYNADARKIFYQVVKESTRLHRKGILKDMSAFDVENHLSLSVGHIRKILGADILMEMI